MSWTVIKSDPKAREKPCLRCGYSLRKITDSTHCPECGLSIWLSLNQNDSLDYSNPEWIRRMTSGLMIMIVGVLLALVSYGLGAVNFFHDIRFAMEMEEFQEAMMNIVATQPTINSMPTGMPSMPLPPRYDGTLAAMSVLSAMGFLLTFSVGLLYLSSPENRHPDKLATPRLFARICAGVSLLACIITLLMLTRTRATHIPRIGFLLPGIASMIVTFTILRHCAHRAGNSGLAKFCGWMLFLPLIGLLKFAPFLGAILLFSTMGDITHYLPLIYLPTTIVLMVIFIRKFRLARKDAIKAWESETRGMPQTSVVQ